MASLGGVDCFFMHSLKNTKFMAPSTTIFFSSEDVETCSIDVALWLHAIRKLVVLLVPVHSSHNSQQEMQPFLFIV